MTDSDQPSDSQHLYCLTQNRLGAMDRVLGALTHRGIIPQRMASALCEGNQLEIVLTFQKQDEKIVEKLVKFLQKQVYVLKAHTVQAEAEAKNSADASNITPCSYPMLFMIMPKGEWPMPTTLNAPQTLNIFYDKDIDRSKLLAKNVAVVGFGSQGYGQSLNLKESGAKVKIALRTGSATEAKVKEAGLEAISLEQAAEWADIIMFLIPDVQHGPVYKQYFEDKLKPGQALVFSHGFSIHYNEIVPPKDVDVFLIAPKSPGHLVRSEYQRDRGVPSLFAVHQDATGEAKELALGYAACLGSGRAGVIETNFKDETETDLFGEQAVLCGGAAALVKAGFETLTEAGYPPELAYFECLHELKLIVDLMYEGGLEDMRYSISDTARYGDVSRGPRVITADTKAAMKEILKEIQSGEFAREWMEEYRSGMPELKKRVEADRQHPLEVAGRKLRGMMSWLSGNKLVNRDKN